MNAPRVLFPAKFSPLRALLSIVSKSVRRVRGEKEAKRGREEEEEGESGGGGVPHAKLLWFNREGALCTTSTNQAQTSAYTRRPDHSMCAELAALVRVSVLFLRPLFGLCFLVLPVGAIDQVK